VVYQRRIEHVKLVGLVIAGIQAGRAVADQVRVLLVRVYGSVAVKVLELLRRPVNWVLDIARIVQGPLSKWV
jgi:hypothetical protein